MSNRLNVVTLQRAQTKSGALSTGSLCFKHNMICEDGLLHVHDCYELEMVTEGNGMQWLNGFQIPLSPGNIFLLSPNDMHRFSTRGPLKFLNVKIDGGSVPKDIAYLLSCGQGGVSLRPGQPDRQELLWLFGQIEHELTDRCRYFSERVYAYLTLILTFMLENGELLQKQGETSCPIQHVRSALSYIQGHIDEEISLSAIAAHCNLSPCYFSAVFSRYVGYSFSAYLLNKRLQAARKLLLTTDDTISDVAFACGFGSLSSFQRAFKNKSGVSPSDYRKAESYRHASPAPALSSSKKSP